MENPRMAAIMDRPTIFRQKRPMESAVWIMAADILTPEAIQMEADTLTVGPPEIAVAPVAAVTEVVQVAVADVAVVESKKIYRPRFIGGGFLFKCGIKIPSHEGLGFLAWEIINTAPAAIIQPTM